MPNMWSTPCCLRLRAIRVAPSISAIGMPPFLERHIPWPRHGRADDTASPSLMSSRPGIVAPAVENATQPQGLLQPAQVLGARHLDRPKARQMARHELRVEQHEAPL